jgi:hypothetical protein
MNQHTPLPPSNVLEINIVPPTQPAETFIVFRKYRPKGKPYLDEEPLTRAEVIEEVSQDVAHFHGIVAYDLEAGKCRDATDDITSVIIERWAQDGKLLTEDQKAFVALCKGEAFANCFRLEEVA